MQNRPSNSLYKIFFILFTFLFFLNLLLISALEGVSCVSLLSRFFATLYKPRLNFFTPGLLGFINVNFIFYFLIGIIVLCAWIMRRVLLKPEKQSSFTRVLFVITFSAYLFITSIETSCMYYSFQSRITTLHAYTLEDKYSLAYGDIYGLAKECQKILPGKHNAQFITDMDIAKPSGMTAHRALAYFLYPIDIRGIREGPKDCLIIYAKESAADSVPKDYKIVRVFSPTSLLAVKKENISQ